MRRIRSLLIAGAALALGCASGPRFLRWDLGAPFAGGEGFAPGREAGTFERSAPVRFRGRELRASFSAAGGRLGAIHLRASTSDADDMQAVTKWAEELCAAMGQRLQRHTPSPLGTPRPGMKWDPVIVTHGRCQGDWKGVRLTVREERAGARDFRRTDLELVAEPPAAP